MNMSKILMFLVVFLSGNCLYGQTLSGGSTDNGWRLYYAPYNDHSPSTPAELMKLKLSSIPATVPGNVEIDLQAAGKIKDPEKGNNVYALRQYEAYQWWYHRTFPTPEFKPGERVEIVFEGLDCLGKIWINDKLTGETDNMLIDHRFDITDLLRKDGPNTIYVCINPAVVEGRKYLNGVVGSRSDFNPESMNIRKAPHMYGWDIMPRLVSAGLWRDVHLEIIKPTRLKDIYWMTNNLDVSKGKAELILDWEIATDYPTIDGLTMEVSLKYNSATVYTNSFPLIYYSGRQKISLDNVKFWWPKGYGEPALYEGTLRIIDDKKKVLDEKSQIIGIRTAELIHSEITSKEKPGEFVFKINGEKIFVRGTNWVPLDALHSRDHKHLEDVFRMINDLNCNMIRCWGGNVYEDHDFFDLCDRNGVMVWQDFAMGCATYPQNNEFAEKIRKEAIAVVLKLRRHPSWFYGQEIMRMTQIWNGLSANISIRLLTGSAERSCHGLYGNLIPCGVIYPALPIQAMSTSGWVTSRNCCLKFICGARGVTIRHLFILKLMHIL